MKKSLITAVVTAIFLALTPLYSAAADSPLPPILGAEQYGSRVLMLDANQANWNTSKALLWDWHPVFDTVDLPSQCIPWFGGVTDCKPVLDMTHILITASSGAVSMVRIKDKKTVFCVYSARSHSAELLPDGNVVSAASGAKGNLELFDLSTYDPRRPEKTVKYSYPLPHIHGVVWDHKKNCLWANDYAGISRWEYSAVPKPSLKLITRYSVPGKKYFWPHDLFPDPGTGKLFFTGLAIKLFDTNRCTFEDYSDVIAKSISRPWPGGPVIALIPEEKWWSPKAVLLDQKNGKTTIFRERENMRFYKFRWFVHNEFSYGPAKSQKPLRK